MMHSSSTLPWGIISSFTESTTAIATALCAGQKIFTASPKQVIETLGTIIVIGFATRLGATTANRGVAFRFGLQANLQMIGL